MRLEMEVDKVVHGLTDLIMGSLKCQKSEEFFPRNSGDQMDIHIKHYRDRTEQLRVLRQKFEDIMCEPIPLE